MSRELVRSISNVKMFKTEEVPQPPQLLDPRSVTKGPRSVPEVPRSVPEDPGNLQKGPRSVSKDPTGAF